MPERGRYSESERGTFSRRRVNGTVRIGREITQIDEDQIDEDQIDVYSRGASDDQNLTDAKEVVNAVLPRI